MVLTLYYLKDTVFLWITSNAFDIHKCTDSNVIILAFDAINKHFDTASLNLNRNKNGMVWKVSEFELKFWMIQAFGCTDGTHILIETLKINSQSYFYHKQFYSIDVQAICDSCRLYIDIELRWHGPVHDAYGFANWKIDQKPRKGLLATMFSSLVPGQ